ncbi:MAG: arylesterase [Gemmatimonadaceae bacterium]|nr:arylesterase [Gemmatimonadaceae bacterium]
MRFRHKEWMRSGTTTITTWSRIVFVAAAMITAIGCGTKESGTAAGNSDRTTLQSTDTTAASATATAPRRATASATSRRVVLVGTSLTAGLGLDPDRAYPALLQRKADSAGFRLTLVNAGLSGETSAGALRRAAWVLDQPAAAVILEVGANDGLRGVDPDSTKANLIALIETIKKAQPNARVLLLQMEAPTNLGAKYTSRFHTVYAEVAQATSTPLLPFLLEGVAGVARLNQADGIHPNEEGARRVAATLWPSLLPHFTEINQ